MQRIRAKVLLDVMDVLVQHMFLHQTRDHLPHQNELSESLAASIEPLIPELAAPEFAMVRISAERLLSDIHRGVSFAGLWHSAQELRSRLADQMESTYLLSLSPSEKDLFEPLCPLFGDEVAKQFPGLQDEIAEAGKCLALGRSTAAAFHGIRCLEGGIRALSRCLQIPDPTRAKDRNWGAMLKSLKEAIDLKWPGSSARLSGDGEFFDNAYAALAAMQNPWRNATMHLDQKYTEEQARHLFEAIKGLMRTLASRMDEEGKPLA